MPRDLAYMYNLRRLKRILSKEYKNENFIRGVHDVIERNIIVEEAVSGLEDALLKHEDILLIGHPGDGKTVFLNDFALKVVRGQTERIDIAYVIPLHILNMETDFGNPEVLLDFLANKYSSLGLSRDFIAKTLTEKSTLVALDGLDEIPDPIIQQRLMGWLSNAKEHFGFGYSYVTSRWDEVDAPKYARGALEPLDPNQIAHMFIQLLNNEYIANTIPLQRRRLLTEASEKFFIYLAHEDFQPLFTFPMYINLAAAVDGDTSATISSFLKDSIIQYLATLQRSTPIDKEDAQNIARVQDIMDYTIYLLSDLAYISHSKGLRSISENEILAMKIWENNTALRHFKQKGWDIPALRVLSNHSSFFGISPYSEDGAPNYYFTHQGIQEILVGMKMVEEYNDFRLSDEEILSRFENLWWRQPILYMISFLGDIPAKKVIDNLLIYSDKIEKKGTHSDKLKADRIRADIYMYAIGKSLYQIVNPLKPYFDAHYSNRLIDRTELRQRCDYWIREFVKLS
ncbi:MAG: NACHT domain-containing protein [archaeon]